MHEIEVKARLENKHAVLERLTALGCVFSEPVTEEDTIYVERMGSLAEYNENSVFVRIRVRGDGKTLLTVKHHARGTTRKEDPHSTPQEHEVLIDSRDQMAELLPVLGYQEALRLQKTRVKTKYQKWEICIDEVTGLGSFIEVEEMADDREQVEAIHEAMKGFLAELGIPADAMFTKRYDVLMLEKAERAL